MNRKKEYDIMVSLNILDRGKAGLYAFSELT